MKLSKDSKSNIELIKQLSYNLYINKKILAELTICQAILEGGLRKSPPSRLALEYNNLFGVKDVDNRGYVELPTTECNSKKCWVENQKFEVYDSIEDSLKAHKILLERPRYYLVQTATTFEEVAKAIFRCGYATDPKYSEKLMDIYNEYIK